MQEMGAVRNDDEVLEVRKFEPTRLGSNLFNLTKQFPIFVEDVHYALETWRLLTSSMRLDRAALAGRRLQAVLSRQKCISSSWIYV